MMTLTPEREIRHDLINVISTNQAMVYLERKSVEDAIADSRNEIHKKFETHKITTSIFKQLLTLVDETFEEFL